MIDATFIGVSLGCIYGAVGIGFSLVYRTTGVLSFAQGAFVMVGGMLTAFAVGTLALALGWAVALGVAGATVAGLVLAVTVVLPLWRRGAGEFVIILGTALFLTICENLALNVLGSQPKSVPAITAGSLRVAGIDVPYQVAYVVAFGVLMAWLFPLWLRRTRIGAAMRACAIDREVASLLGISPRRTALVAFAIVAALAGLAGCLIAPLQFTAYNAATAYNTRGFIAAMLGGLGDVRTALAGGLLLGLAESYIGVYLTSRYLDTILLVLLVLVIFVRPQGVFARKPVA